MKRFYTVGVVLLIAQTAYAREQLVLARVTVYWHGEGQQRACWNGAPLRTGDCAVDPRKIPYGSKVAFDDVACTAVDSGPAVVSRKAARVSGRTVSERNALVIDRFFETKGEALSWAKAHPHFMTVRISSARQLRDEVLVQASPPKVDSASRNPAVRLVPDSVQSPGTPNAAAPAAAPWQHSARRRT